MTQCGKNTASPGQFAGFLAEATMMKKGQKIRVRASMRAATDWGVAAGAEGVVLCGYRVTARGRTAGECVDVLFGSNVVVWGAPVAAFEEVGEVA